MCARRENYILLTTFAICWSRQKETEDKEMLLCLLNWIVLIGNFKIKAKLAVLKAPPWDIIQIFSLSVASLRLCEIQMIFVTRLFTSKNKNISLKYQILEDTAFLKDLVKISLKSLIMICPFKTLMLIEI